MSATNTNNSEARRSGLLQRVSDQVVTDFAVVFRLNAHQIANLRDVIAQACEDDASPAADAAPAPATSNTRKRSQ